MRLLALLEELAEGLAEANTVDGFLNDVGARAVDLADVTLLVCVDDKTDEIGTHVVATEVVQGLAKVSFIQVNVDVDQTLKVLSGLSDQGLTVRAENAGVAVVLPKKEFSRRSWGQSRSEDKLTSGLQAPFQGESGA